MAILEKEVEVKLIGRNVRYYENLGYFIPRKTDVKGRSTVPKDTTIMVKIKDLPLGSNVNITKICDYCGKRVVTSYHSYTGNKKNAYGNKDSCSTCSLTKIKETCLIRYGTDSFFKSAEYKKRPKKKRFTVNISECVATVDKEFAKLFVNKEDTFKYMCQSNKNAKFKCSECGYDVGEKKICNVFNYGLSCTRCSDGISYPEKFLFSLLEQLGLVFKTRKKFKWSENKEYDFYIPSIKCIIETHGGQHYDGSFESCGGRTLKEEQLNDDFKRKIALENGIENYVEIDCRKSDMEYVKQNILTSKLNVLVDLSTVNWLNCHKDSCGTLVKKACDLWMNGIRSTVKIGEILNLNFNTVRSYLKMGRVLKWCDYYPESRYDQNKKRVLQIAKNGEILNLFTSIAHASVETGTLGQSISRCCRKERYFAGGYFWRFEGEYDVGEVAKDIKNALEVCSNRYKNHRSKEVFQLTESGVFIAKFNSLTSAHACTKVNNVSIGRVCNGKGKTAGGYKWMYKEDYEKYIEEKSNKEIV